MQLQLRVLHGGRAPSGGFVERATAVPGDTVQLLATVRNAAPRAQVLVRVPKTVAQAVHIVARVVGAKTDVGATVEARHGMLGLAALRFTCVVRTRTFCPAVSLHEGEKSFQVVFDASRAQLGGPVVLASTVVGAHGA